MIFSDIVRRNNVKKVDQLERVVKYTFQNVGNTFSAKSVSDYLKSEKRALDNETVYSYLEKLEKAYILHRCSRFDLQGRKILKTQENSTCRTPPCGSAFWGTMHRVRLLLLKMLCIWNCAGEVTLYMSERTRMKKLILWLCGREKKSMCR